MSVSVTHENGASVVHFEKPPLNLLDIDTMNALIAAHKEADQHPETRVIITKSDVPGIFCNGLNPKMVISTPAQERVHIFNAIGRLLHELLFLSKPHIAALNGPAMAGGAILAIAADFRYMNAQHGRFCFAEAKVGLPVPKSVLGVIQLFCKPAAVREIALLGKNMDPAYALEAGMVDGLADNDEALEDMVAVQTARLSRLSPAVLAKTKRGMRDHLFEMTKAFADHPDDFIEFCGPDFLGEGLTALLEKRSPQFKR